jgi:hypothetical protein
MPSMQWTARAAVGAAVLVTLLTALAPVAQPAAGASEWRDESDRTGSRSISARQQSGLAAAPDGTLYLYGGARDGEALDDLWRLPPDGRWERLEPPADGAPPGLIEPHLVVDGQGRLYELGGVTAGEVEHSADLYRYDPAPGHWLDLSAGAEGPKPPGRQDHGFVYVADQDAIYVFGGQGPDGDVLADFWRYSIASNRWEDLTSASGADSILPRELYNLSYDGGSYLYLLGGTVDGGDGYGRRLTDFWRYDLARGHWADVTLETGADRVPGRHYYGQACDADGNFYVLGGYITPESENEPPESSGDFWVYRRDTGTWQNLSPLAAPLLPRTPYNMVRDPRDGSLVVFGGAQLNPDGSGTLLNDFWRWDPPPPSSATPAAAAQVDRGGGELATAEGVALDLPTGALASSHALALRPLAVQRVAQDTTTFATMRVEMDGGTAGAFDRRAELSIRLDLVAGGPATGPADVYRSVGGGWQRITQSHMQAGGRTLMARVDTPGIYSVVARERRAVFLPLAFDPPARRW